MRNIFWLNNYQTVCCWMKTTNDRPMTTKTMKGRKWRLTAETMPIPYSFRFSINSAPLPSKKVYQLRPPFARKRTRRLMRVFNDLFRGDAVFIEILYFSFTKSPGSKRVMWGSNLNLIARLRCRLLKAETRASTSAPLPMMTAPKKSVMTNWTSSGSVTSSPVGALRIGWSQ